MGRRNRYPGDVTTETEIKVPVDNLLSVRRRLEEAGWRCVARTQRETNLVLDVEGGMLDSEDRLLRLRSYAGTGTLTFKGPTSYSGAVKVREELEVQVSDLEAMAAVFARLGFHPAVRYEKDREVWRKGPLVATLDHTPMGDFVEVEGDIESVAAAAASLGVDPARAVRGSYISLWEQYRLQHPDENLPKDMVFAR